MPDNKKRDDSRPHTSKSRRSANTRLTDGELHCSFCNKSQYQVKKLIAGPSVYICDECIDICNEIIEDDRLLYEQDKHLPEQPSEAPPGANARIRIFYLMSGQPKREWSSAFREHWKKTRGQGVFKREVTFDGSSMILETELSAATDNHHAVMVAVNVANEMTGLKVRLLLDSTTSLKKARLTRDHVDIEGVKEILKELSANKDSYKFGMTPRAIGDWISVEEMVPFDGERVLVWIGGKVNNSDIATYLAKQSYWVLEGLYSDKEPDVTHWTPIRIR